MNIPLKKSAPLHERVPELMSAPPIARAPHLLSEPFTLRVPKLTSVSAERTIRWDLPLRSWRRQRRSFVRRHAMKLLLIGFIVLGAVFLLKP
jgi:hypothetical protein